MNKKKINRLILLLLLLPIWSCQTYYEPTLDKTKQALVVEGILTDIESYLIIKVRRTVPYDSTSIFDGVEGAEVILNSISGETFRFIEDTIFGYYQSVEPIKAQIGKSYFLHIITPEGDEYQSEVEEMLVPKTINDIKAVDTSIAQTLYTESGEPFLAYSKGISFSAQPATLSTQDVGFIYGWSTLVNFAVNIGTGIIADNYYCWELFNSKNTLVYSYDQNIGSTFVPFENLHFLSYYFLSPLPLDTTLLTIPLNQEDTIKGLGPVNHTVTSSFYYILKQYTITKAASSFWSGMKRQSEATGKLFDPVEEEVPTNIYCISDPNKKAYGYFNTAACSQKIILIKLKADAIVEIQNVESLPSLMANEGCFRNEFTEFWY